MPKIFKLILITLTTLICSVIFTGYNFSNQYIIYAADPMDALNNIGKEEVVTTQPVDPNAMPAVDPNAMETTVAETGNEDGKANDGQTVEDIKKNNAISEGVRFMDTVMYVVGMLCCLIPVFIIGFWGMATINPVIFDPIFHLATLKKLHYTDITLKGIVIRALPIIIFGIMLNGGLFKALLGKMWFYVGEIIYS